METKQVLVFGNEMQTAKIDEKVYVLVKDICKPIGVVDVSDQYAQIRDDELYAGMIRDIPYYLDDGRSRRSLGISLDMIPIFLARINRNKIKEEKRPILLRFQLECAKVLAAAWKPPSTQLSEAEGILQSALNMMKMLEVPIHIAQVEAVKMAQRHTSEDLLPILQIAPAQDNIELKDIMLEPTELGEMIGKSGMAMNKIIRNLGLQVKVNKRWVATEAGKHLCSSHQWNTGVKSGYNYKWNIKVLEAYKRNQLAKEAFNDGFVSNAELLNQRR